MKKKILLLTVGGSCAPIITSIKTHEPVKIVFFCSSYSTTKGSHISVNSSDKKICNGNPSIAAQLELEEDKYEIVYLGKGYEDDPDLAFQQIKEKLKQLLKDFSDYNFIADFTGGTKSMSIALFNAAISFGTISPYIVTGSRKDLVKVQHLTQAAISLNFSEFVLDKQLSYFYELIQSFDYASGLKIIESLLKGQYRFPPDIREKLDHYKLFCQIFDYWDKFDHATAYYLINIRRADFVKYALTLEKIITNRKILDKELIVAEDDNPNHKISFEIVNDLLINAQRKALQYRYDDAIGRIYRAIELFMQLYLLEYYDIETSNVDPSKLGEDLQDYFKKQYQKDEIIKIGLLNSYDLITQLEKGKPLGELFANTRNTFLSELQKRNNSLLAHGFNPVTEQGYSDFYTIVSDFFNNCYDILDINKRFFGEQFPNSLNL